MNKEKSRFLTRISIFSFIVLGLSLCSACSSGQSSNRGDLNSNSDVENYKETEEYNTNVEKRMHEVSKLAETYSYTQFTDSTLKYNKLLRTMAEDMKPQNDSIAEEFIRSTFWNYLSSDLYTYALEAGKRVYDLRKTHYGPFSDQTWDWLQTLQWQAFKNGDLENMAKFAEQATELAIEENGYTSPRLEEQLNVVNKYASSLMESSPEFTLAWIQPYYEIITKNDLSPALKDQYETLIKLSESIKRQ